LVNTYSPFTGQFIFEVDGLEIGAFQQVSGLSVEVDASEIKEGGQNEFIRRVPGRMKWPNLVLKRGVTTENNLFEWFRKSSGEGFSGTDNQLERRQAALALVDAQRTVLRIWVFNDAFPVKWKGPEFAADSSSVATEELEVAHHGFWVDD